MSGKESSSPAALRKAITDAARAAFTKLRQKHPKEAFYSFALFTSGEASYVMPTANSEEGLRRKAAEYAKREGNLEEHRQGLRWSPCDWEYHCAGDHHFSRAQELLEARPNPDDLDDFEREFNARLKFFVDALKALDKEGFFGTGKERQKIVLLVMMGDQDTTLLLDCAKKLNSPKVYKRFSEPFLVRKVGKFKHVGSRNVYEMQGPVLSADGRILATAGDATVLAWQLPRFNELLRKRYQYIGVWDIAVSPDGATVALGFSSSIGNDKGGFQFWNVAKQKLEFQFDGAKGNISAVAFSPDGTLFVCAGMEQLIRVWDVKSRALVRQIKGHKDWVQCIKFTADGKRLFSSGRKPGIRVWNIATGERIDTIDDSGDRITLSRDDKYLAVAPGFGPRQSTVRIWDLQSRRLVREIDVARKSRLKPSNGIGQVSAVAFSADTRLAVFATSGSSFATLWDWKAEKELLVLDPGGYESLDGAAFLPGGESIALTGRGFNTPPLVIWDISEALTRT